MISTDIAFKFMSGVASSVILFLHFLMSVECQATGVLHRVEAAAGYVGDHPSPAMWQVVSGYYSHKTYSLCLDVYSLQLTALHYTPKQFNSNNCLRFWAFAML
jgi:hypothetical protein